MLAKQCLGETTQVFLSYEMLNQVSLSRTSAVEMLYATFPALMYIDPSIGTPLLEPLFQLQASPDYGVHYAARDLGMSCSILHSNHSKARIQIF
jgi:Domain of unknown function (DUF4965)